MNRQLSISEVCSDFVDCVNRTAPETPDGGFFAVGTPAMHGNVVDLSKARHLSLETFTKWTRRLLPKEGDLFLAREAPVGPVVRVPPGNNIAAGQRTVHLRADPAIANPRYLYYLLVSPVVQNQLLALAMGSTVPHLRVADIAAFKLPELPPLSQQLAIAEVLGALDDKIAANNDVASVGLSLARNIYRELVKHYPVTEMSSVVQPILGGTPSRTNQSLWGGLVPWVSAKDVTNAEHGVIISTSESITELAASKSRTRPLPIGTVVLTARGTVGTVARLGIASAVNQSCYGFIPDLLPAPCLFFAIEDAANQASSLAHGSVFDTITMRTFEHVVLPDASQQDWKFIEHHIAPILSRSQQAVAESQVLASARDQLLPLLMSGRIRIKDAEKAVEEVV